MDRQGRQRPLHGLPATPGLPGGTVLVQPEPNEQQIRQEYAWVPEMLYRAARRRILEGFLERPAVYTTAWFRERDESRARENLRQALARLET